MGPPIYFIEQTGVVVINALDGKESPGYRVMDREACRPLPGVWSEATARQIADECNRSWVKSEARAAQEADEAKGGK